MKTKPTVIFLKALALLLFVAGCISNQEAATNDNSVATNTEELSINIEDTTPNLPSPTRQVALENTPIPIAATPSSKGTLTISSFPSEAEVRIVEHEIVGITPFTATLSSGNYTVILSLPNYQSWEEIVIISAGETSHVQGHLVPNPMGVGEYIPLIELGGIGDISKLRFLVEVAWTSENNLLEYAYKRGASFAEAKDWLWEMYDLREQLTREGTAPVSAVDDETRKELGVLTTVKSYP